MLKYFLTFYTMFLMACQKQDPREQNQPIGYPLSSPLLTEVSGMADSHRNTGYLWMQEDSNTPSQLSLVSHKGILIKHIPIKGILNRDWEDMAIAASPNASTQFIYLAETGDNDQQYKRYAFYRFPEPSKDDTVINAVQTIAFQYPDGSHDAEAFLIDPTNQDIYVFTKRQAQSQIYKLTFPYSLMNINTLSFIDKLPYNLVVSAAISPDQKGIAIKTYQQIYYYTKSATESIPQALQKIPVSWQYLPEIQGEAFCFTLNNLGYYTISERVTAPVTLYYYKR